MKRTQWLAKHCVFRHSTIWRSSWPKKALLTNTTAHFPLSTRYTNSQKPRYSWECKGGDILSCSYTTFTKRGTVHIYGVIPTQILLNIYTDGDASILCTDKIRQRYCGTNRTLRLCKISYLQYVKNKTPVSSNTFPKLVCSKITATQAWAFKQFCLKMCKSNE